MKPKEDFVYCSNWKCDRTNCARHHYNQPWNVCTIQRKYEPNGKRCAGYTATKTNSEE